MALKADHRLVTGGPARRETNETAACSSGEFLPTVSSGLVDHHQDSTCRPYVRPLVLSPKTPLAILLPPSVLASFHFA